VYRGSQSFTISAFVFILIILDYLAMFTELNFPDYPFRIRRIGNKNKIFDQLRKKYVTLTEEEWVRQHMISYLMREQNIPAGLIRIESGLKYEKLKKRTDIVVYGRNGKPGLVIECKSPIVKLDKEVLFQAGIYAKSLQVSYIGITNGLQHFFWRVDLEMGTTEPLSEFPVIN
jgi:type I site-specific restriction endonuclease